MRSSGCTGKATWRITIRFGSRRFRSSWISAGTCCGSAGLAANSARILMGQRSGRPRWSSDTNSSGGFSVDRIIQIVSSVRLADRAAHLQYLSLVVEDVRDDAQDDVSRAEQPRLARIADHLARQVQFG